jgi:hypothetical protein
MPVSATASNPSSETPHLVPRGVSNWGQRTNFNGTVRVHYYSATMWVFNFNTAYPFWFNKVVIILNPDLMVSLTAYIQLVQYSSCSFSCRWAQVQRAGTLPRSFQIHALYAKEPLSADLELVFTENELPDYQNSKPVHNVREVPLPKSRTKSGERGPSA